MSIESRTRQRGIVFDHWQIREYLGSGSGGKTAVFRLVRSDSDRGVSALKVVNLIEEPGAFEKLSPRRRDEYEAVRDECSASAEQEVWMMDDLRGNTNIVDYLDHTFVDWEDEHGFGRDMLIRMELLKDLRSELRRGRVFTEAEILKIGRDICVALILCHRKKILHRDVKPENIFLNKDGNYKLGDFGVSRVLDACPGAMASTGVGTYEYWPVEQMSGRYDNRVDTYSLGLVLYELSNQNRLPFAATTYTSNKEVALRLSGTALPPPSDASDALAAVILKACAPSPEDRFDSAGDMLKALQRVSAANQRKSAPVHRKDAASKTVADTVTKPVSPPPQKKASRVKKGLLLLLLLVLVFAAGAATVIGLYEKRPEPVLPAPETTAAATEKAPETIPSAAPETVPSTENTEAPAPIQTAPTEPSETTIPETTASETEPVQTAAPEVPDVSEADSPSILRGIVNNRYPVLNIRSGPYLAEKQVGQYRSGTEIEILETRQVNGVQWARTDKGWVCMTYIHLTDLEESVLYTGWVIFTDQLKVRSEPSVSGKINAVLDRGEIVYLYETAVSEGGIWGRIDSGWVSLHYIDMLPTNMEAVDVRVVASNNTAVYSDLNGYSRVGSYDALTLVYVYEYGDGPTQTMARTERGWVQEKDFIQ